MKARAGVPVPPTPDRGRGAPPGHPAADVVPPQRQSFVRRHPGRVRAIAFAVSIALHLLVVALYPPFEVSFGSFDPAAGGDAAEIDGIEVIQLVETAESESPREPEVVAPTESPLPPVTLPLPQGDDLAPSVTVTPPDAGPGAAERLRPTTRTEELWMPLTAEATALSDEELVRNLIYRRLAEFNDSMAIQAAREARGTDWTYTDDDGNRWGITPGQLHLGSITIPLPFGFGTPAGASDDRLDQLIMEREIQRAAGLLQRDQTIRERAAAIKARIDAERARRGVVPDSAGNR